MIAGLTCEKFGGKEQKIFIFGGSRKIIPSENTQISTITVLTVLLDSNNQHDYFVTQLSCHCPRRLSGFKHVSH